MLAQGVQLEYDENAPPPHILKTESYKPIYELHEVAGKKLPSDGLVMRYDPENEFIGIGCRNGSRIIYSTSENKIVGKENPLNENSVTTLKWRPMNNTNNKVLATGDSEGTFQYWHIPSMKKIFFLREENNVINTIDFSKNGTEFATAGKDCNIRIYDEQTKSESKLLKKADWNHIGHDNRVFALKFIDEFTLISGGWDSVIHIWDLRQGKSVKHFYGSHISGESLDFQDGMILAGCYAAKNQVQIWNLKKGTKEETIDWTNNIDQAAYVYAAGYSHHDIGVIGAASTGAVTSVKLWKDLENKGEHVLLNEVKGANQACFSFDFSRKKSQFAFTTAHHGFYVFNYERNK